MYILYMYFRVYRKISCITTYWLTTNATVSSLVVPPKEDGYCSSNATWWLSFNPFEKMRIRQNGSSSPQNRGEKLGWGKLAKNGGTAGNLLTFQNHVRLHRLVWNSIPNFCSNKNSTSWYIIPVTWNPRNWKLTLCYYYLGFLGQQKRTSKCVFFSLDRLHSSKTSMEVIDSRSWS